MEKRSYLTPKIRALVGKETKFRASEPVGSGEIRRLAKALGFEDSAYSNEEEEREVRLLLDPIERRRSIEKNYPL